MSVRIGADIEAICGKCGDVWHVIVAAEGEKVARVQCKQCSGYHRYRSTGDARSAPAKARTKAAAGAGKARKPKAPAGPKVAPSERPARTYSPKARFEPGDVVLHPTFGEGVVQAVPAPGKMEVWFSGASKLLVHERAG